MFIEIMNRVNPDNIDDGSVSGLSESAKDELLVFVIMITIILIMLLIIVFLKYKIDDLKEELEKAKNEQKG